MSLLDGRSAEERKSVPLYRGFMLYFPDAMCAVAELSYKASKQHGHAEMHWEKNKSSDHVDCMLRHLLQAEEMDTDGVLHATKVAWRAMANLQVTLDRIKNADKEVIYYDDELGCLSRTILCVRCHTEVFVTASRNAEGLHVICEQCLAKDNRIE